MSTSLYAIRCKTTKEQYKPGSYGKYWRKDFNRAKIYSNIAHAKSALTQKLNTIKSYCEPSNWGDPEEKKALRKFKNAEIVCVGQSATYYNIQDINK